MRLLSRAAFGLAGLALIATFATQAFAATAYRTYVNGKWGQIHVRVDGEGNPATLILLHKMVWSSVEFRNVQPLLATAGFRTIAVDIPGYGLSDAPNREPTAEEYAEEMIRPVMEHFHLRKASLLGIDSGATIVAIYAERHPEQVERLLLDGPPVFSAAGSAELLKEKEFDRTPRAEAGEFVQRWHDMIEQAGPIPSGQSAAAMHQGIIEFFTSAPTYLYGHHAIFKHDLAATLQKMKVPTLIMISGSGAKRQRDLDVTKIRSDFAAAELTWPGMHPCYDAPRLWTDAVVAYLKPKR